MQKQSKPDQLSKVNAYIEGDPDYELSRKVFNGWVKHQPAFIFKPNSIKEIQDIIQFANDNELTMSIKNGGHSAYGQSISKRGVVIDMINFKGIKTSTDLKTVTVEGGVLSGELDLFLSQFNLAIPLGDCPGVGVSGVALGGGNGLLSRKYGLTCDFIRSVRMISAQGIEIQSNDHSEPQLLWALKGAGQNNFGVITSITFDLISLPPKVTVFNYFWSLNALWSVLEKMENLLDEYPNSLALFARVNRELNNEPSVRIYGMYPGVGKTTHRIKNELETIGKPLSAHSFETTYFEAQQINASSVTPDISFHWENAILYSKIDQAISDKMAQWFIDCPGSMGRINLDPMGGKIESSSDLKSAFQHREGRHILSIIGVWPGNNNNGAMKKWTTSCFEDIIDDHPIHSYQNYAGIGYSIERYFGKQTDRLLELKRRWDPKNIFEGILSCDY